MGWGARENVLVPIPVMVLEISESLEFQLSSVGSVLRVLFLHVLNVVHSRGASSNNSLAS